MHVSPMTSVDRILTATLGERSADFRQGESDPDDLHNLTGTFSVSKDKFAIKFL